MIKRFIEFIKSFFIKEYEVEISFKRNGDDVEIEIGEIKEIK